MANEHPNVSFVREQYAAFARGDIPALLNDYADDIIWHYINLESPLHGDYEGREGVMHFFAGLAGSYVGSFRIDPVAIVRVGDDLVVQHVTIKMDFEGRPYQRNGVLISRIIDGKVREIWDIPGTTID
jgi:ketosteroid isomerase-like protein